MSSKKIIYKRTCSVPWCTRKHSSGTCAAHRYNISMNRIWVTGWVNGEALGSIAKQLADELQIGDVAQRYAVQRMRGGWPRGPWGQRPVPRLNPIMKRPFGHPSALNNLLVGRKYPPTFVQVMQAIVHRILQEAYLGNARDVSSAASGASFFYTRALFPPPGKKTIKGDAKHHTYRLRMYDFKRIGYRLMRVSKAIGCSVFDPEIRFRVCQMYASGIDSGKYQAPFRHLPYSNCTSLGGDHPFCVYLPNKFDLVPLADRNAMQRQSGKIGGEFRRDLDMLELVARYREQKKAQVVRTAPLVTGPDVDTDFIFDEFDASLSST